MSITETKTDTTTRRCIVCLGRMKDAKVELTECSRCGRFYHKQCAKRVQCCVMCGADFEGGN